MTVSFMKWVDRRVGIPLCVLVSPIARLLGERHPKEVERILVVKFWGMGSIILAAQALKELHESFPRAQITAITFCSNAAALSWLGQVDEILTIRRDTLGRFVWDLLHALEVFWRRRFDVAIDFEFATRFTALLAALSKAPVRIGFSFHPGARDRLFTVSVPFRRGIHVRDNFIELVRAAGARPSSAPLILDFPASVQAEASAFLGLAAKDAGGPLIAVNPNVGELALERRWPGERFIELSRRLLDRGARLVFIGADHDASYVRSLTQNLPCPERWVDCAGKTDFRRLGGVLSSCDLLVSSDSGPVHLAWALCVPTVSLFGPETPVLYGPPSGPRRILYLGLKCSPCMEAANTKVPPPCPNEVRCVREITVDQVVEAIQDLLSETHRPQL